MVTVTLHSESCRRNSILSMGEPQCFEWEGFDEMNEVRGAGSVELQDDGHVGSEFNFHNGDDAVRKAS